jgi:hypothetical protein
LGRTTRRLCSHHPLCPDKCAPKAAPITEHPDEQCAPQAPTSASGNFSGSRKCSSAHSSRRLFWSGVPVMSSLLANDQPASSCARPRGNARTQRFVAGWAQQTWFPPAQEHAVNWQPWQSLAAAGVVLDRSQGLSRAQISERGNRGKQQRRPHLVQRALCVLEPVRLVHQQVGPVDLMGEGRGGHTTAGLEVRLVPARPRMPHANMHT